MAKKWQGEVLKAGDPRLGMPDVKIVEVPIVEKRYLALGYDDEGNQLYHPMIQMNANNYKGVIAAFTLLAENVGNIDEEDETAGLDAAIAVINAAYPTVGEKEVRGLHFATLLPLAYDAVNGIMEQGEIIESMMEEQGVSSKLDERVAKAIAGVTVNANSK